MMQKRFARWGMTLALMMMMGLWAGGCTEASPPEDAPDWEDIEGYEEDGRPTNPDPGYVPPEE